MIYFIRQGSNGPIKIGHTNNVELRLKNLQIGSPYKLEIVYVTSGDLPKEKEIHDRFKHLRLESEWFIPEKEIFDYIAELQDLEAPERVMESYHPDLDECRICGLIYNVYRRGDELAHIERHKEIKEGKAIPFPLIEVLKNLGWAIIRETAAGAWGKQYSKETGKRMVAFAWWMDVRNKVPDWDFEAFMAAHLDLIDAMTSGNEEKLRQAEKAIAKWH